jgi:hypothetical protein
MKLSTPLSIFSQTLNFAIFIYFIVTLLKINALDMQGLIISAFGLFASLISGMVSSIEDNN